MSTVKSKSIPVIPKEFPTNAQDWANYIGHFWNANEQIQIVLEFAEELNFSILNKAVRMSLDAEPILGCKFVQDNKRPYWRRHEDIDQIEWCTLHEVEDKEVAIEKVLSQPFASEDYQVNVTVIRSKLADTLCIKLNHACCDGGGAKDYLHLLSYIYNHLYVDKNFIPELNITGIRDSSILFDTLGISNPKILFDPQLASLKPTWAFPSKGDKADKFHYSICRLNKTQTDHLHLFTRKKGVTINDMILSTFYRAMINMVQPEENDPMEICVTVDLRRYLPNKKADAICNLSGVVNHRIDWNMEEDPILTLERVSLAMKEIKKNNPGLHSAASMEIMSEMNFEKAKAFIQSAWEASVKSKKSTINLSNFGYVTDYPLKLGSSIAESAYMVTPVFRSPSFMLGVSNYNNVLTFTVGYCEPEIAKDDIETFILLLQKELLSFID